MALTLIPSTIDFAISGPTEWQPDSWGLDRQIIPYSGPYSKLQDFVDGLSQWGASPVQSGNFFLSDFGSDGHKQWPTVRVVYSGKKGGTLPPDRNSENYVSTSARFTSFTGKTWVNIEYLSPISTVRTWDRDPIDLLDISPAAPADIGLDQLIVFTAHSEEGRTLPADLTEALTFFAQKTLTIGSGSEEVAGEYYVATLSQQNVLISVEF